MKVTTLRLDDGLVKAMEKNAEATGSSLSQEIRATLLAGLPERKKTADYFKQLKEE